jgi:hypothetical protein
LLKIKTLLPEKYRWEYRLSNLVVILFLSAMCFRIFYHIAISSNAYLDFVTDDFFYYLLPAKNLILHGISSFDGMTITNGYHPLWMISISTLYWVSGGSEQIFFALLALVSALSSYITFRLLWKLQEIFFHNALLLPSAILIASVIISGLSFLGMEITLTIPLYAYILVKISQLDLSTKIPSKQFLILGFLSSLLILSRLDTGLLILLFLIFFFVLSRRDVKNKMHLGLYFALGGILVPVFFLLNYFWFGHFLTVSSLAKTLKSIPSVNFGELKHLALNRDGLGGLILAPLAFCGLLLTRKKYPAPHVLVYYLVLIFPFIYYFIILFESDWFLNRWYLYPLPFCFFISIGIFSNLFHLNNRDSFSGLLRMISISIVSIGVLTFSVQILLRDTTNWKPETTSVFANAEKMKPFVSQHPGIYAMGDQAGLTAYILGVPIIQLEGLNSDFKMYEHIKHEDNLNNVLLEYHADYLIETSDNSGLLKQNNFYHTEEPHTAQAGTLSKKMRGVFSHEPIYRQSISNSTGYEMNTYIFDLK